MSLTNMHLEKYFPHKTPRPQQVDAINFAIDSFLSSDKKYVIIEAGTGVGKSAIGMTIAGMLGEHLSSSEEYSNGAWFVTTQKILQDQYIGDFGSLSLKSIKSSSNYKCRFKKRNSCSDSLNELRSIEKGTKFWNTCTFNCTYKNAKESFIASKKSITNFPYFLTESSYSRKITPRNFLVIDEAHNVETELSKFIEISVSERFSKSTLKLVFPDIKTQHQALQWVEDVYYPKLKSHLKHTEKILEKYKGLKDKLNEFTSLSKQLDLLSSHHKKLKRFLEIYDKDNWIFDAEDGYGRKGKRIFFKPIDISQYSDQLLFRFGEKILMMSATILDKDSFCQTLGIPLDETEFISLPSPFPRKNRPIFQVSIGSMSKNNIDNSLPKIAEAVKQILEQHKNDKGIIHAHSYKIANYIKKAVRSRRILIHDSNNRDIILKKHKESKTPTVLISPSMTEGVDLAGDCSRFQIICKVPYPFLGDKLIKKRMNKWRWWYPLQTAKTIMQSVGRSVRNRDDFAVTYILDSDWYYFYQKNGKFFPEDFKKCIK
tara:strand:- start:428 stop:2053 length:1626 start_codon:yes stop_codon:yes gene_type:complete